MDLHGLRQIEDLIAKHRLEDAINDLQQMLDGHKDRHRLIDLSGRYHLLEREYKAGKLELNPYSV